MNKAIDLSIWRQSGIRQVHDRSSRCIRPDAQIYGQAALDRLMILQILALEIAMGEFAYNHHAALPIGLRRLQLGHQLRPFAIKLLDFMNPRLSAARLSVSLFMFLFVNAQL